MLSYSLRTPYSDSIDSRDSLLVCKSPQFTRDVACEMRREARRRVSKDDKLLRPPMRRSDTWEKESRCVFSVEMYSSSGEK